MSNELVKAESRAVVSVPMFTEDQIQIIKNMYFKGSSDDEFRVFLYTCERTGLDPVAKQIYPIKRKSKKPDGSFGESITIQTGIDGYRLVAERTGRYCPGKKPTYEYDKNGKILSATAYVKKLTKDGTWHVVEAEAAFEEYVQGFNGKPSGLWEKMPRVMLAKCAEALAIRKCFPAELSGVYTQEEMAQADVIDVTPGQQPQNVHITIDPVKPIEYITAEQVAEIEAIKKECDPKRIEKIDAWLKQKCGGQDISKLKAECFRNTIEKLLDAKADYLAKKIEIAMSGEEVQDAEGS